MNKPVFCPDCGKFIYGSRNSLLIHRTLHAREMKPETKVNQNGLGKSKRLNERQAKNNETAEDSTEG